MKRIEAIIRSSRFEAVRNALHEQGVDFFTYNEVYGVGNQPGRREVYRGAEYQVDNRRMQITIIVGASKLDQVLNLIMEEARTGEVGDGKIFVSDVEQMIRIRDGKVNEKALDVALI
jgi:nitrogen regulatory protein P-II 1